MDTSDVSEVLVVFGCRVLEYKSIRSLLPCPVATPDILHASLAPLHERKTMTAWIIPK